MLADNRTYTYDADQSYQRAEHGAIASLIPPRASVVDFGCGDGSLLHILAQEKQCRCLGFDLSATGVSLALEKGIQAECRAIDQRHSDLKDKQFDYAICNVTLQMVNYPETLMEEMARVAKYQVISFPNFAHLRNRFEMLLSGRMPRFMLSGYEWFSTGHIHQFSNRDFEEFAKDRGFRINQRSVFNGTNIPSWKKKILNLYPNLFGRIMIYHLEHRT